MIPPAKVDILIVKLTFLPMMHPEDTLVTFTDRKRLPNGSLIRDWFYRTMEAETATILPNVSVRCARWYIALGNPDLFTINGFRFEKIRVIFGEEAVHWVYYRNGPTPIRVSGSTKFPISCCTCCFHLEYSRVMEIVKDSVMQHFIANFTQF